MEQPKDIAQVQHCGKKIRELPIFCTILRGIMSLLIATYECYVGVQAAAKSRVSDSPNSFLSGCLQGLLSGLNADTPVS